MKPDNIETIVNRFITASVNHASATEIGNSKNANKNYKIIRNSLKVLKEQKRENVLIPLLNFPNIGVRMWSAYALLGYDEQAAVETLNEIIKSKGIHSLDAQITLEEWRKGNLKLNK